ncbi:hypothetical protein [Micromonospora sp. NPDC050495]|uniref:hypothetical protein n=1 Tax=Micromonospora sp. NPDC050495 TaxID=3154936 RepID=UPI0033C8F0A1
MSEWPHVNVPPTPPPAGPATVDPDRARTRWRLDRQRNRRRVSQALDELCVRMYGADEAAKYGIPDRRRGGR